jgi:hypothetical protein
MLLTPRPRQHPEPGPRTRFLMILPSVFEQNAEHPAEWLSRPPQQLITHREGSEILGPHRQFVQTADRDRQGTGNGRRRQIALAELAFIGNHLSPRGWPAR